MGAFRSSRRSCWRGWETHRDSPPPYAGGRSPLIVADTGAIIALIDGDDRHHMVLRELFEADPDAWVLPWAILPEVDYVVSSHLGRSAAVAFRADLSEGTFTVEWNGSADVRRAHELDERYSDLDLGLVDAVVMATAERLEARAIATLDLRDFGAVELTGRPELWPRDLWPVGL